MNAERRALVNYRMEQAGEALEAASLLLDNEKLRSCISRSYYAMFYAVLALLAAEGRAVSKHAGAISAFDREFVKVDLFDRDFSRWLHEAFDLRQRSDYREMFTVTRERAGGLLDKAGRFVAAVKQHLTGAGKA